MPTSETTARESLTGECHCGAVRLRIPWRGRFDSARRCDCSFCRRRSVVVASVKVEELELLEGTDRLTLYQWGTGVAEHYFCSVCGIYTHHRRRSNPSEYGVNIANFPGVDITRYLDVGFAATTVHPKDR